ncbi:hypothetical protein BH11PSE2_BH11PSE2_14610 [soil metagenome]
MGNVWRRRGVAAAVAIGVHLVILAGFMTTQPLTPPQDQITLVELVRMPRLREPEPPKPETKPKPPAPPAPPLTQRVPTAVPAPLAPPVAPSPIPPTPPQAAPTNTDLARAVAPKWPLTCNDVAALSKAERDWCANPRFGPGQPGVLAGPPDCRSLHLSLQDQARCSKGSFAQGKQKNEDDDPLLRNRAFARAAIPRDKRAAYDAALGLGRASQAGKVTANSRCQGFASEQNMSNLGMGCMPMTTKDGPENLPPARSPYQMGVDAGR